MLDDRDQRALDQWCRFLGRGNPKAALWIVGIEEGGPPRSCGEFYEILEPRKRFDPIPDVDCDATFESFGLDKAGRSSSVRFLASKLAENVFELGRPTHRRGLHELFKVHGQVFLSNAYPLSKPNSKVWRYQFSSFSRNDYQRRVEKIRPPLLRRVRPPGSFVVCHGEEVWPLHREAFLHDEEQPELLWDGHLQLYRRARVILAPFFSWRGGAMTYAKIEEIASLIKRVSPNLMAK